jgi:hypothetical protein
MRTDCAERLEFTLFRLSDHRLSVRKDLAAADRDITSLTVSGPAAALDSPVLAAEGSLAGAVE